MLPVNPAPSALASPPQTGVTANISNHFVEVQTTGGRLLVTTLLGQQSFAMPTKLPNGVAMLVQVAGNAKLATLVAVGSPLIAGQFPTAIQERLASLLASPKRLLSAKAERDLQIKTPTGMLSVPKPAGLQTNGDLVLAQPKPGVFQLFEVDEYIVLEPDNGNLQAKKPSVGTGPNPNSALAPFERGGPATWQQLAHLMARQQGSNGALLSLAELTSPQALAELITSIGAFPYSATSAPTLGILVRVWHRLLGLKSSSPADPIANHIDNLNNTDRSELLGRITPLIKAMTQFQQQSDAQQPHLCLSLPYLHDHQQRELQLSLQGYQSSSENQDRHWLLTLRFDLDNGTLLLKARYQQPDLFIEAVTSNQSLSQSVNQHFDSLTERFSDAGFNVAPLRCRVGDVPKSLTAGNHNLTYGGGYG